MISDFQAEVYELASKVPKGKVTTYKAIAEAIAKKRGKPMSYRAVGQALHRNPFTDVPCHRVVSATGRLGGWTEDEQRLGSCGPNKVVKLKREGVHVVNGKIVNFTKVVVTKF